MSKTKIINYQAFIISFILHLLSAIIYGQEYYTITGTVYNQSNQALTGSTIIIQEKNSSTIIDYAISNSKGEYSIKMPKDSINLLIKASMLGYESVELPMNAGTEYHFKLKTKTFTINSIKINAPKITVNQDTTRYNVQAFKDNTDRVIGDVLEKLPGMQVTKNGNIVYNGKPVTTFLIEGENLLENKYNIATKNIPANMVSAVEVIENDQRIKVLKNYFSTDKITVNLTFNEKYKSKYVWNIQPGVGFSPLLWENKALVMRFAKKTQNLTLYKGANTGLNFDNESEYINIEDLLFQMPDYALVLYNPPVTMPMIEDERFLSNNTHIGSINNLWVTKKDYRLNLETDFLSSKKDFRSESYTNYLIDDLNINDIYESIGTNTSQNKFQAALKLEKNHEINFLNNELKFILDNQTNNYAIAGTENANQKTSFTVSGFKNRLRLMHKTNQGKILTFQSYIKYAHVPVESNFKSDIYDSIFNFSENSNLLTQTENITFLNSHNQAAFNLKAGKLTFRVQTGYILNSYFNKSGLYTFIGDEALMPITDSTLNNLHYSFSKAYINLTNEYTLRKCTFQINMPFNLYLVTAKNYDYKSEYTPFTIEPYILIKYKKGKSEFITSYRYYSNFDNYNTFLNGYLLADYRNFSGGNFLFNKNQYHSISVKYSYKNTVDLFFSSIGYNYNPSIRNLMYKKYQYGILAKSMYILSANTHNNHWISGTISKGFYNLPIALRLDYFLSQTSSTRIFEEIKTNSKFKNYLFEPTFTLDIGFLGNIEYSGEYTFSENTVRYNSSSSNSKSSEFLHKTKLGFEIGNHLVINTVLSLYRYTSSKNQSNLFTDFSAIYSGKLIEYEFIIRNIFNTQVLQEIDYSNYLQSETIYFLNPRQILFKAGLSF